MRHISIFGLAVLGLLACKRDATTTPTTVASAAPASSGGGPSPEAPAMLTGATCDLPDSVEADVTLKKGCIVEVKKNVLVAHGRTLTIEPGVTLRFHPKAYLEIGHKGSRIVARGTKDQPIVFTSALEKPAPGAWVGIIFDDAVGEGSVLEHAVVEFGGRESHGGRGALTAYRAFPAGRLAIRDVTFRNNANAAVHAPWPSATFAAFQRNVFRDNERAVRTSAAVLAAFGAGNDLQGDVEVVGGTVAQRGTWPAAKITVSEPVYVNGHGDAVASLTIARGAVLRFASKTWLEVGTAGPAELEAAGVTFTSASTPPKAGDWVGLFFGDKTRRARVFDSTIEYAGAEEHESDAAVTFVGARSWQALDVHFSMVSFRHIKQAHFSSNGDGCDKALDPKFGITWASAEPCR